MGDQSLSISLYKMEGQLQYICEVARDYARAGELYDLITLKYILLDDDGDYRYIVSVSIKLKGGPVHKLYEWTLQPSDVFIDIHKNVIGLAVLHGYDPVTDEEDDKALEEVLDAIKESMPESDIVNSYEKVDIANIFANATLLGCYCRDEEGEAEGKVEEGAEGESVEEDHAAENDGNAGDSN